MSEVKEVSNDSHKLYIEVSSGVIDVDENNSNNVASLFDQFKR